MQESTNKDSSFQNDEFSDMLTSFEVLEIKDYMSEEETNPKKNDDEEVNKTSKNRTANGEEKLEDEEKEGSKQTGEENSSDLVDRMNGLDNSENEKTADEKEEVEHENETCSSEKNEEKAGNEKEVNSENEMEWEINEKTEMEENNGRLKSRKEQDGMGDVETKKPTNSPEDEKTSRNELEKKIEEEMGQFDSSFETRRNQEDETEMMEEADRDEGDEDQGIRLMKSMRAEILDYLNFYIKPKLISPLTCKEVAAPINMSPIECFIHDLTSLLPDFLEKYATSQENGMEIDVHPIDVRNTIFRYITQEMRCFLTEKLFALRLAVPFLLQSEINSKERIIFVRNLLSIRCENEKHEEVYLSRLPLPIIAFARVGDLPKSKSFMVNRVLMDGKREVFYNDALKNGDEMKLVQEGTIDLAWHHQKETSLPSSVVLNFHGDAMNKEELFCWVCKNSNIVVIFFEESTEFQQFLRHVSNVSPQCTFVIFPLEKTSKKKNPKGAESKSNAIFSTNHANVRIVPIKKRNENRVSEDLVKILEEEIKNLPNIRLKSLYEIDWVTFSPSIYSQDDHLKNNPLKCQKYPKEREIMDEIVQDGVLDQLWRNFVIICKQLHRAHPNRGKSVKEIKTELDNKKADQMDCIFQFSRSKRSILENFCYQLCKAKEEDNLFGIETVLSNFPGLSMNILQRILEQSFDLEDNHVIQESMASQLTTSMLLDGHSVEFIDGSNGWTYRNWLSAIFQKLDKQFPTAKVVVLSVLGVQSSYKSTLLNNMFGLSFRTGLGRCTNGVHANLLDVDPRLQRELGYSHILVLDVEGLQSVEKREESGASSFLSHDNELATAIVCLSDLCMINIKGDNTGEMEGILNICLFALVRMKMVNVNCKTVFVHQNVNDPFARDATQKLRRTLEKQFDEAKKIAISHEGETVDKDFLNQSFQIDLENSAFYLPNFKTDGTARGHYTEAYSKSIALLKEAVLKKMQGGGISFKSINGRVDSIWEAILNENFVFSFNNAMEIYVNSEIEKEFQKTWNLFNRKIIEVEGLIQNKIENRDPDFSIEEMVKNLLEQEKTVLLKELTDFFDAQPNVDIKSKSKDSYLHKMKSEMNSATNKQILRLKQSRSIFTFQTSLKANRFSMERRLLKRCQEEAKNIGDDDRTKENVFERLFKREKKTYFEEAQITCRKYWEKTHVKNYLEEKLYSIFSSVKHHMEILEKYKDFDCYSSRPKPKFEFNRKSHFKSSYLQKLNPFGPSKANQEKAIHAFLDHTESTITKRVNAFLESRDFTSCGVCETTLDEILKEIQSSTKQCRKQNIEIGSEFTKTFVRDFCYYMAFEVFSKKLCDLQLDFIRKNDPYVIIEQVKPKMREIFLNFCRGQSQLKTICKQLIESLNKSINAELMKKKQNWLRESLQKHPDLSTNQTKIELINKLLLECLEMNGNTYDNVMAFVRTPDHSIRGFIRRKIENECNLLEKRVEEEKKSIDKEIRNALRRAEMDLPSEQMVPFNAWLKDFSKEISASFKLNEDDLNCFKDFDISRMADFNAEVKFNVQIFLDNFHKQTNGIEKQIKGEMTQEFARDRVGCTCQCPICGTICDSAIKDHAELHYSTNHSSICLGPHNYFYSNVYDDEGNNCIGNEKCSELMKLTTGFRDTDALKKWDLKKGEKIRAFWLWFIQEHKTIIEEKSGYNFREGMRKWFGVKIQKNAAIDSLKHNDTYY